MSLVARLARMSIESTHVMSDRELATFGVVLLSIILAVGVPLAVRLWRNNSPYFSDPATLARMGKPATARAFRRLFPMSILGCGLMTLALGVRAINPAAVELAAALIILTLMCHLLALLVAVANWPKALVPPHLRRELGYLSDRRRSPSPKD